MVKVRLRFYQIGCNACLESVNTISHYSIYCSIRKKYFSSQSLEIFLTEDYTPKGKNKWFYLVNNSDFIDLRVSIATWPI